MTPVEEVLSRFPKRRPPLPRAQQAIYEREYLANREGRHFASALAQKLEGWMHRAVRDGIGAGRVLEVGAGTLNQVPYFKNKTIDGYDVVEPARFLYENSPWKGNIRRFYRDVDECRDSYDAIFSVAALEHIVNLPHVLAKMGLLLSPDGVCVNAIPSEGGFLWGTAWRLSTGLAYRLRTGFSYRTLLRHEHVNDHDEIIALHRHFFRQCRLTYFPAQGKHASLYCCIVARAPRLDVCSQWAEAATSSLGASGRTR